MAADLKWKAPTVGLTSYLTTELNTLADNAIETGGAAINNQTNLCTFMDIEIMLASADFSSMVNPAIVIYLLESIDGGTDYDTSSDGETADDNMPPVDKIITTMGFRPYSGAEAKVIVKSMIPIPPGFFKIAPRNQAGMDLAASGNILSYRTYNYQSV